MGVLKFYTPIESNPIITGALFLRNCTAPRKPPSPPASVNPKSIEASATGGPSNLFQVIAAGNAAPWSAQADTPWLTLIDPTEPVTGDYTVLYAIAMNATGNPRTGRINIAELGLNPHFSHRVGESRKVGLKSRPVSGIPDLTEKWKSIGALREGRQRPAVVGGVITGQ